MKVIKKVNYFLSRQINFNGVPVNSKLSLNLFSKNLSYEKCIKSGLFTERINVGGQVDTCEAK